jgi:hypothetical protein
VTNTLKHAQAQHATVRVRYAQRQLELEIADDGQGPDHTDDSDTAGHGLTGLRERAALYGGELHAGSAPDGGFCVYATLPSKEPAHDRHSDPRPHRRRPSARAQRPRARVRSQHDMQVAGEAADGREALARCRELQPDIARSSTSACPASTASKSPADSSATSRRSTSRC